jgi:hypothetical protein
MTAHYHKKNEGSILTSSAARTPRARTSAASRDIVAQADALARFDADAEFTFGLTALLRGIDRLRREPGTLRRSSAAP